MSDPEKEKRVCGRSLEAFLDEIVRFHGHLAPGLVLGGYMVDWGQEMIRMRLGPRIEADAVVETSHCLPDAVQIFTPCTIGNGWLKVLDWDKFALTLYDKKELTGFRVWLDLEKARRFPNLINWYLQRVSKQQLPLPELLDTMMSAGRRALSCRAVKVIRPCRPVKKKDIAACPACGEGYPRAQGSRCLACQGEGYCIALNDGPAPD